MSDKLSFRVLGFITTPKRAEKALAIFDEEKLPIQYVINASGTASSETIDILGLGSPDRSHRTGGPRPVGGGRRRIYD